MGVFHESSNEKNKSNKIKTKDSLENIKSKYIIKKIFNYLPKNKSLDIIKYNKKIQKRIDININDYENYSKIEIEIKPEYNINSRFININKGEEKYYHIFFNDNKEEIKRNYLNENEQVTRINIIIDYEDNLLKDYLNVYILSLYILKNLIRIILII